jgi:uncharacterized protein
MRRRVLVDTGAIVALLKKQDQFHQWAKAEWSMIEPPLLTCETVIAEACFLLRGVHAGQEAVMSLISRKAVQITFRLDEEVETVTALLDRYESVPMSLADACLVRMTELYPNSSLLTLDSDFLIYRKLKNQTIPVIMPP